MEKKLSEMNKQEVMSYLNKYDKYKHRNEWRHMKVFFENEVKEYKED